MKTKKIKKQISLLSAAVFIVSMMIFMNSCGNQNSDATAAGMSSAPSTTGIDYNKVEKGKVLYEKNCTTCHTFDTRSAGPALQGVTQRRTHEWITEMIQNPDEMLENDATAKSMLAEYNYVPMPKLGISEQDAENIFEYLRKMDGGN